MAIQQDAKNERVAALVSAAEQLARGTYRVEIPVGPSDQLGRLGLALESLARALESRQREFERFYRITARINSGVMLEEVLDSVYEDFRELIPYDRIGFALLEDGGRTLRAQWARTDLPVVKLKKGYAAPMHGSSLEEIIAKRRPRILNDLAAYLRDKPESESTRLIVEEGIRSSLTCPLVVNDLPIGFLFFSSIKPGAYDYAHVEAYQRVADQLSMMVEKGRLISELAKQKAAVEKQNEELLRLNELKNSFLGMAAHDLRNPIATIDLITSMLVDDEVPLSKEEETGFFLDIKRQTEQMLALLNDLLDVSRIESGKLVLRLTRMSLREFLEHAVRRHAKLAEQKKTRVERQDIPDYEVEADPQRLRQVMDNLLTNAVKFSPPGSTVTVRAKIVSTGVRVEVSDQGPGITVEDRKRLFQDFVRLSAQPTAGESSTGLGLAITKRVVEAHGGIIGVDSEPGNGATFWFTLRWAKPQG